MWGNKTYQRKIKCINCDNLITLTAPYGVPLVQFVEQNVPVCKVCGCYAIPVTEVQEPPESPKPKPQPKKKVKGNIETNERSVKEIPW